MQIVQGEDLSSPSPHVASSVLLGEFWGVLSSGVGLRSPSVDPPAGSLFSAAPVAGELRGISLFGACATLLSLMIGSRLGAGAIVRGPLTEAA
jgi:hypothetical protein